MSQTTPTMNMMTKLAERVSRRRARIEADVPHGLLVMMDHLVKLGRFDSRSALIRAAVERLVQDEFRSIKAGKPAPSDRGQLPSLINPDPLDDALHW